MEATVNSFNPDYDPTGIEGGVDTNRLPWVELVGVPGVSIKPMRASTESGTFSLIVKFDQGLRLERILYLGSADLLVLSGCLVYSDNNGSSRLEPGVWGYMAANTRMDCLVAEAETECLMNFQNSFALISEDNIVRRLITSADIRKIALSAGIGLVPSTLADCAADRANYQGPGAALAIAGENAGRLITDTLPAATHFKHPYFIDCRAVPWVTLPNMSDVSLKILRVSQETGQVSLIVRHNGVALPHNHLGASDFLVLQGHIGYRAGPPEGYGPGVWFFEPAGARHDATQRVGDEDLVYTANLYGPLKFDSGRGTAIVAVLSWMEYLEIAEAGGAKLVPNSFANDSSLLAWAPIAHTP